jgi:hypothetical protein
MKAAFIFSLSLMLSLLMSRPAHATVNLNQGFNAFAGVAVALTPGTFRMGYNAWEGGMISPGFLGAIKSFPWGPSTYSSFGFGINSDGFKSMPGFQAAAGFDFDMFWNIGFRGEVMARTNLNGNSVGYGLLGLSYGF